MRNHTRFSAHAGLAAVGQQWQALGIWAVVEQQVHIHQKVLRYQPTDKLLDAFITILAGGGGVVEVNRCLRTDRALQRAFGRSACADQSTVSDTLNACTPDNVREMRTALQQLLRQHGRAYRHDYAATWQVLDVDLSGWPTGPSAEGATKGYFPRQKSRRGRQMGRVLASHYDEIVFEQLYPGSQQLEKSLPGLVTQAEAVLDLSPAQRARTVVRVDGGGGTETDLNWLLARDYAVLAKSHNWKRATKLAASVSAWHTDPRDPQRQAGWVSAPHAYARPTRQIALRWPHPKQPDTYQYALLVSNLPADALAQLAPPPLSGLDDVAELWLTIRAYDQRGGGIETSFRGSKDGLQINHRNKGCFEAQAMLLLLAELAYNLLTWLRSTLGPPTPAHPVLGVKRLLRDVLAIPGRITCTRAGQVRRIKLNAACAWAATVRDALAGSLASHGVSLHLGQI
jgi:hypothetical protein